MTSLSDAATQMIAAGMPPFPAGHPKVNTSRVVRYGPKGKAWYRLYETTAQSGTAYVSGAYGLWGLLDTTKIETDWRGIDPNERVRMQRQQAEAEAREKLKQEERAHAAANRAKQQWEAGTRAGPWPYLDKKSVTPEGVRAFTDGTLLVPMIRYGKRTPQHDERELVGLQKISPKGDGFQKLFNKGMAKEGAALELGEFNADHTFPIILVGEGYSTCRTLRMATGEQNLVVVAFDSGNLLPVVRSVRRRYPEAHILMCADDDWMTKRPDGSPFNPGMHYAHAAANAVGAADGQASIVRPLFPDGRDPKATDFNDLHAIAGLETVRQQILGAMISAMQLSAPAESVSTPPEATAGGGGRGDGADHSGDAIPDAPDRPDPENGALQWRARLARTEKGQIRSTTLNISMILTNDKAWDGIIAKNEFSEAIEKLKPPPYEYGAVGEWTDIDDVRLRMWIEARYGFTARKDDLVDAVIEIADRHRYHPVKNWLATLNHDGKNRIDTWMIDCLGAPDTPYVRMVSRKFLIMAIARIMRPGCKAENVLILEGRQGLRKSTALKALASASWFTDVPLKIGDKEAYVLMQGVWIIEMAELDSLSRSETSASKLFFSQTENHYRPWYAKRPIKVPRQCIITGSVNDAQYLKDDTGNRRYWPIKCGVIDIDKLIAMREQLFAEALAQFNDGAAWWVQEDERSLFEWEQEERHVGDAYTEVIAKWLDSDDARAYIDGFRMTDFLREALKLDIGKWTRPEQQRVGHCLHKIGLERKRASRADEHGRRDWIYVWPPKSENEVGDVGKRALSDEQQTDDEPF